MDIPDPKKWMTMAEVAKLLRMSHAAVNHLRRRGTKSITGEVVLLAAWRSPSGWVTTREEVERYLVRINC